MKIMYIATWHQPTIQELWAQGNLNLQPAVDLTTNLLVKG